MAKRMHQNVESLILDTIAQMLKCNPYMNLIILRNLPFFLHLNFSVVLVFTGFN